MNIRQRKLMGVGLFVVFTTLFFLLSITIAFARLPGTSVGVQLLFYGVCTVIWFFVAAVLIRWMQKPSANAH